MSVRRIKYTAMPWSASPCVGPCGAWVLKSEFSPYTDGFAHFDGEDAEGNARFAAIAANSRRALVDAAEYALSVLPPNSNARTQLEAALRLAHGEVTP